MQPAQCCFRVNTQPGSGPRLDSDSAPAEPEYPDQTGAALFFVLVVLLSLTALVVDISARLAHHFSASTILLQEYQADIRADQGLDLALNILASRSEQQDSSILQDPVYNHQDLSITILPCSSRLNLRPLSRSGEQGQRIRRAVLSLVQSIELGEQEMQNLLDWIGFDPQNQEWNPSHWDQKLSNTPYDLPLRPLSRPEELLLVPGFQGVDPGWVSSTFTIWGRETGISLDFAGRETVLALLPELEPYWEKISAFRQTKPFTHPNQLLSEIGLDARTYSTVLPYIHLDPEYFEIIIEVRQGSWYEKRRYIARMDIYDSEKTPEVLAADILEAKTQ